MSKLEQQSKQETGVIDQEESIIPGQYKNLPSEIVEELWQNPRFVDPEKNRQEDERRAKAIEAIKQNEALRETEKEKHISDRYSRLTDEQKVDFPNAQKDAKLVLDEYIHGKRAIDYPVNLSREEAFVLEKIKNLYQEFKKNNPDKPFAFDFARDIDKRVYSNLAQTLSLKVLGERQGQKDQEQIKSIRTDLGLSQQENYKSLSIEERKKLFGWDASYELAKIAQMQGIDLPSLSREEYTQFAIDNSLRIGDDQLRAASWQRAAISIEELMAEMKKKKLEIPKDLDLAFTKFSEEVVKRAGETNRFVGDRIRIRQGTKDSGTWLYFGINEGDDEGKTTYKAYISLKDVKKLTPDRFKSFMTELQKAGYNGDIKIFQDLVEQGTDLNDQIVMHGRSRADAEFAMKVAEKFFGSDIYQKSFGKDETIDGKSLSYSEVLAKKIKEGVLRK